MEKIYPVLYNQNDYPNVPLGNSLTETIAAGGCFDCSFAMKACYYGHQIDPVALNQKFNELGIYVSPDGSPVNRDLLGDNALEKVFADIKYVKTFDYEPIPTDLGNIFNLLSDPTITVTLRINLGNGNLHFVEAVSADPTAKTLHIANPLSGKIEDFQQHYGDPITAKLHAIIYSGPPPQAPASPADQGSSPLAVSFRQAITKSTNFDVVCKYLGISNDQAVQVGCGQQVVDRFIYLQQEIESLHKLLDEAQKPATQAMVLPNTTQASSIIPPANSPTLSQGSTPVVIPPITPVFQNGKPAVGSNTNKKLPKRVLGVTMPTNQSGSVGIWEFIKSIIHVMLG